MFTTLIILGLTVGCRQNVEYEFPTIKKKSTTSRNFGEATQKEIATVVNIAIPGKWQLDTEAYILENKRHKINGAISYDEFIKKIPSKPTAQSLPNLRIFNGLA